MDPISAGLGVLGFGLQLFGGIQQSGVAKQEAQISSGIASDEQQINVQKNQQMQLQASRANIENFRRAQQYRSQATTAATAQGAQFGSGLQGGLAGITAQSDINSLGINQNLEIGQNIFGINNDISSKKMQLASLGGQAATDQGLSSLGGALVQNAGTIGGLSKDIGAKFGSLFS